MRDYQVQGLNWMAGLHFNGINGILADEMVSIKFLVMNFRALTQLPFSRDWVKPFRPLLSSGTSNSRKVFMVLTS